MPLQQSILNTRLFSPRIDNASFDAAFDVFCPCSIVLSALLSLLG